MYINLALAIKYSVQLLYSTRTGKVLGTVKAGYKRACTLLYKYGTLHVPIHTGGTVHDILCNINCIVTR